MKERNEIMRFFGLHPQNDVRRRFAFTFAEGATHVDNSNNKRKFAFTLAEVLITLGIIGVVAALTIPTLIQNYQTKSWNTAATVFEKELKEALRVMNIEQTLAGYKTTEDFMTELSKHLNITKKCTNEELKNCFTQNISWVIEDVVQEEQSTDELKYGYQMAGSEWKTNTMAIQVANGVSGILAYNPKCKQEPFNNQFDSTQCVALIYDVNGFSEPNIFNKDIRSINVDSFNTKRVFKAGSNWYGAIFWPATVTNVECKKYLSEDFCASGNGGYWAGAVAKCGGVDKIPNRKQLGEIAGFLCDKPAYGTSNYYNSCTLNVEKIQQIGLLQKSEGGNYQLFGDFVEERNGVNTLMITADGSAVYNQSLYPMGYNTFQAVCIVE